MAIGDLTIGRGYEPAILSGDREASAEGKLQVRPLQVFKGVTLSPFCFYDIGYVDNLDLGSQSRTLRSAGVGLDVRLEHRHDRRAGRLGRLEIAVDKLHVRIHHAQPLVGRAPEHVARAGGLGVQELAQDHPPGS